jgi:hypothetical protein
MGKAQRRQEEHDDVDEVDDGSESKEADVEEDDADDEKEEEVVDTAPREAEHSFLLLQPRTVTLLPLIHIPDLIVVVHPRSDLNLDSLCSLPSEQTARVRLGHFLTASFSDCDSFATHEVLDDAAWKSLSSSNTEIVVCCRSCCCCC